jgi:hypothetical protein
LDRAAVRRYGVVAAEKGRTFSSRRISVTAKSNEHSIHGRARARNAGVEAGASAEMQAAGDDVHNAGVDDGAEQAIAKSPVSPEIREPKILWASLLDLV